MDEFISKFVLNPYLVPHPKDGNATPMNNLTPHDTLLTLFAGFESPFIMDINDLRQMLDNLNRNIPNMINLQSEYLDPGPKPYLYSGSLSLWLSFLHDPKYHLFSLNTVPNFDNLELKDLIDQCIDMKTAPGRAAWAIHKYVIAKDVTQETLTNILITNPKFWKNDPYYFSELGYDLYTRNLLQHAKFIEWMIKELKPENLIIFKKELLKTHALLYYAFQSDEAEIYINFFQNDLMLNKSQLIQFSIISQIQENSFEKYLIPLLKSDMKRRAKQICDLTRPYLAFSSSIRNLLFLYFPFFDTETFASDIRKLVHFSDEEELKNNILCACKSVLWFNRCIPAISYNIAYLIKFLLDDFKNVSFPLDDFLNILLENSEDVSKFAFLFAELQEYHLFNYYDFLKKISKRGLLITKHDQTSKLITNLPCTSKTVKTLMALNYALNKAFPDNTFQEDLHKIFENIKGHVDMISELPFIFRYDFGMYLIKQSDGDDFIEVAKIVHKIGAPDLIVPLFQKTFEKDPSKVKWTMEIVPIVEDIVSAFGAKKAFESLVSSICSNLQNPANVELAIFIVEHYKQHGAVNKYKGPLNEIAKKKVATLQRDQIIGIFQNFSYLCSLQVYDAFFSVKTVKDFQTVFPVFLKDLLEFKLSSVDDVYEIFLEFAESSAITRAADFFVRNLIVVFFQSPTFSEDDRIILILKSFFSKVLLSRMFSVSSYFDQLFGMCRKVRGKGKPVQPPPKSASILIQILLEIIENNRDCFPTEVVLTESVVKGFNQSFPPENNPLITLLNLLRSFPPPIINVETLDAIESETPQGMAFAAALFSLLPAPLQSPNFIDVFDYFKANVTRWTSTFWALWLKLKYRFTPGFPVGQAQFDKESTANYRKLLISSFSSLLFHSTPGDEKTLVNLNCWALLCQDKDFSKIIVDSLIKSLQTLKLQVMPSSSMIMFYHSSLMVIDDKTFDTLCEGFCKYTYDEMQFEQFAKFASSVFAIYVSKFPSNSIIIQMIADKVLEWIPAIHKRHSECYEYMIDVFNFILCFSNDKKTSKSDDEINSFQEDLHMKIRSNLQKIPDNISKYIILNMPPQVFIKAKEPLYSDFTLPVERPSISQSSGYNDDQGFNNAYGNSFNNVYNNSAYNNNNNNSYNSYNNNNVDQGFSNNFDIPFEDDYHDWF